MKKFKRGMISFVSLLLSVLLSSCTFLNEISSSVSTSSGSIISEESSSGKDSSSASSSDDENSEEDEDIEADDGNGDTEDADKDPDNDHVDDDDADNGNTDDSSSSDSSDEDSSDSSTEEEGDEDAPDSSTEEDSGDDAPDSSTEEDGGDDAPDSSTEEDSGDDTPVEGDDGKEEEKEEEVEPPQPTPTYQVIKPLNDGSSSKVLIKTQYKTDSAIIVDAIATDFGADPTGKVDSTSAIQNALNSVASMGGGTVFLPSGEYLVTSNIFIPDYVSLIGDWNKPIADNTDEDFDYGTVILAKPQMLFGANPQDNALFTIGNCGGMIGLTFYYVEQNPANVKNYGYTIYANAPATATFKNLTLINSAYGIGVSLNTYYNELVNLENIYGTFLYNAVTHNATTDVGFYDNIHISTKYWKNASSDYQCKNETALDSFVNDNLIAITLGDLDDQLISNVIIDGGKIGIKFTTGLRNGAGFWGLVHNANITCQKGVYADYLNPVSGVVFTYSKVGIIENNSSVGCIKMSNSAYESMGTGKVLKEGGNVAKDRVLGSLALEFSTSERLFIANTLVSGGTVDNSASLQSILNSVGEEGGIVVIPNGIYRLDSSVVIPKNVEIRSTQSIFSRSNHNQSDKNGVVFITYVTGATFVVKENAGVVGVRIWHAKNDFITAYNNLKGGSYVTDISVKADGAGAYAYMNESVGAYVGFDF